MKPRLYLSSPLAASSILQLNKQQSHYLITVMRMTVGSELLVFNGKDGEWLASIIDANPKQATIQLHSLKRSQTPEKKLTLLFAPTKNVNSTYIIEKATELGATTIIPIITQRSVVTKVNLEKLNITAIEAAEQCERISLPNIHDIIPLKKILLNLDISGSLIFFDESKNCLPINKIKVTADNNAVLIGPEGGFNDEERDYIRSINGCIAAHMGARILRADTAVIAGLSAYQAIFGDWNNE
jgi:16S rRNA (uracil1498-N3)-methyltransferase